MGNPQLTNEIIFTQSQKEVLYGALLGDGCLYLHKQGKNANFIYSSKSRQHVEYVASYFKDYISGEGIKDFVIFDCRTNKEYNQIRMRTYTNRSFTEEYHHWYSDGKKRIPADLKLTPLVCLVWYIGDGGICHGKRSEHIKLATNCFSKEDQETILLPQLQMFEARLMKADVDSVGNQQYFIYIPHNKEADFLNYIGSCPFSDYDYKWMTRNYINSVPKSHTKDETDFCTDYKNGMSYYEIAKKYSVDPSAVRYYLIKNGVYNAPDKKLKTAVIQLSQTGEYLAIYRSQAEAGRILGLSSSMICSVLANIRKMTDNTYFKRYEDLNVEEQTLIKEKFSEYFN